MASDSTPFDEDRFSGTERSVAATAVVAATPEATAAEATAATAEAEASDLAVRVKEARKRLEDAGIHLALSEEMIEKRISTVLSKTPIGMEVPLDHIKLPFGEEIISGLVVPDEYWSQWTSALVKIGVHFLPMYDLATYERFKALIVAAARKQTEREGAAAEAAAAAAAAATGRGVQPAPPSNEFPQGESDYVHEPLRSLRFGQPRLTKVVTQMFCYLHHAAQSGLPQNQLILFEHELHSMMQRMTLSLYATKEFIEPFIRSLDSQFDKLRAMANTSAVMHAENLSVEEKKRMDAAVARFLQTGEITPGLVVRSKKDC